MTTLAEVRAEHERDKRLGFSASRQIHSDRAFLLSLLDEIEEGLKGMQCEDHCGNSGYPCDVCNLRGIMHKHNRTG